MPNDDTPAPARIVRSRKRGWRLPPNTVCVTRPSVFGNPWSVAEALASGFFSRDPKDRKAVQKVCVDEFRRWLTDPIWTSEKHQRLAERRAELLGRLSELRGKNLACFCPIGWPCHADVLLQLANEPETCHA